MKSYPIYFKVAGALLLLASLLLPLSSCESYVDKDGHMLPDSAVAADKPLPPGIKFEKMYTYFFKVFEPADPSSWLMLVGFTWPVIMLVALSRFKGRTRAACRFLEVPLLFGSVLSFKFAILFASKLELGAYVAYAGIGTYALGAVWADIDAFRQWNSTKTTKIA